MPCPHSVHPGQRSELLCCLGLVLIVANELHGRHIPQWYCASAPHYILCARPQSRPGPPVRSETSVRSSTHLELAVEALNKCIMNRLAGMNKVQGNSALEGPGIQGMSSRQPVAFFRSGIPLTRGDSFQ